MKRTLLTLSLSVSLVACAQSHHHRHGYDNFGRNLAATVVILGAVGAVAAAAQPQIVYPVPLQQSVPHRLLTPQQRVITSYDPCYRYGQAVQTYDQWGYPMGYQICR